MSNFIQCIQVNQNFRDLSQYGGIIPLANAKIWVGVADQDPKSNPVNVFIIDADGTKQQLNQPFFTDSLGNFTQTEDRSATAIYPMLDEDNYSLYIEFVTDGQLTIFQRKNVAAGFNSLSYQNKSDLKNITGSDKTGWDTNAPTALSVDQRFTALENSVITKTTLSDAINSNNSQQGASSKAVLNLKNYFSYENADTEYIQSNQARTKSGDYGLIKVTLINGGQGGQGGLLNVTDNKPVQLKGGDSGDGIIIWLISELIGDTINITVGNGGAATADGTNLPTIPNAGGTSKIEISYESNTYTLSTSETDSANLHHPFIHDFQFISGNQGGLGQLVNGKDSTETVKILTKSGRGGNSPILIEAPRFTEAGAGGLSGKCSTDNTGANAATAGQLGLVIIQRLKV